MNINSNFKFIAPVAMQKMAHLSCEIGMAKGLKVLFN